MLTTDERLIATQYNLRARQLFWRGLLPENHPAWTLSGEALNDWVLDFQTKNDLVADGCMGPSTLLTLAAMQRGGVGGFIFDGKEVCVDNIRVARMFTAESSQTTAVKPNLICVLCMPEIARTTRDRLNGSAKIRAHFTIDSSIGTNHTSLVVQWADPMRSVPFCPVSDTGDYPKNRQCIGIEMENFLLMYQIDADDRQWRRRRTTVKATINKKTVAQPLLYPSQISALEKTLNAIEKNANIPHRFPIDDHRYQTDMISGHDLDTFEGTLGKFNYIDTNHEPGAGFACSLETLFGKLETPENKKQEKETQKSLFDSTRFDEQRAALAAQPQPTTSFQITHEDTPRFNLNQAIAAAYAAGRGARTARIAQRCKKFDQ